MSSPRPSANRSSSKRLWGFRLAAVFLAVAPFLVAELYLRSSAKRKGVESGASIGMTSSVDLSVDPIFDTGQVPPLFKESDDGTMMRIPEERFNFFRPAEFSVEKPLSLRRVFVLGGSTVQGRPYETETAFAKWAELYLRAADPDHQYELINCGGVSYASYRVAIVLDQVLKYSPDAIVIYTGHNEFLEERSYGTLNRGPLDRLAESLHLVKAMREVIQPPAELDPLSPEVQTRLDLQNGMARFTRDKEWRDAVVEHFAATLESMLAACQSAGVLVVLCLPACDLVETPPFKVAPIDMSEPTTARWLDNIAIARDVSLDAESRIKASLVCLEIDPEHAGANYILGRLQLDVGLVGEAMKHLTLARDHDVCPLRATTPILKHVEQVASKHRVPLIRCSDLLDPLDHSGRKIPDGIADPSRFADHIHPTITGHQEIGIAVGKVLGDLFQLESDEVESGEDFQASIAAHMQTLDTTYFQRGKKRLEGLRQWASGRSGN